MKSTLIVVLVIILLLGLAFGLNRCSALNQSFYFEPGNCPECGAKLVKGVYGAYAPNACWYCPNCE